MGLQTLWPAFLYFFERMGALQWYFILSAIAYVSFIGIYAFVTGGGRWQFTMKPWYVLAGFVGMTWLLFTIITSGSTVGGNNFKLNLLIDADKQVYSGLSDDGIKAIREHISVLQDKRCIDPVAQTATGVTVYKLRGVCIQGYFVVRVVSQLLFILL